MKLHFTKMQGCGNDYIYVNGFEEQVPQQEKPALVRRLSDRHFGVGGDGVIFINPSEDADCEMEMYNADGSRGEMCGNGIRCVARYVYDRGMTGGREVFTIESCGKSKLIRVHTENGTMMTATVNMGAPILDPVKIPVLPAGTVGFTRESVIAEPITAAGRTWKMTCVSMGNPHAVIFLDEETSLDALDLPHLGPQFENHPRFPNRINTEFAEVIDRKHIRMRVWERGTGETLACGTGACAVAAAGVLNGFTGRSVDIGLTGGTLHIDWEEASGDMFLTGPAEEVFTGTAEI